MPRAVSQVSLGVECAACEIIAVETSTRDKLSGSQMVTYDEFLLL